MQWEPFNFYFSFVSTSLAYIERKTKITWDEKINFNIYMEHHLSPILRKAFICVTVINLHSPPPPTPPPPACKVYFSATPKRVTRLRDSRFGWVTVMVTFVRVRLVYTAFSIFRSFYSNPLLITMVSKISHWATVRFWWECKLSRPILAVTNAVRQFNLHAR